MQPTAQQLYQLQYWTLVTTIAIPIVAAIIACWLAYFFSRKAVNEQSRVVFFIEKHFNTITDLYRYLCVIQNDVHNLLKPVNCNAEVVVYLQNWNAACKHQKEMLEMFYASQIIIDRQMINEIEAFMNESQNAMKQLAIHENTGLSNIDEKVRQQLVEQTETQLYNLRVRIGWYCQDILRGKQPSFSKSSNKKHFSFNLKRLKFWNRNKEQACKHN